MWQHPNEHRARQPIFDTPVAAAWCCFAAQPTERATFLVKAHPCPRPRVVRRRVLRRLVPAGAHGGRPPGTPMTEDHDGHRQRLESHPGSLHSVRPRHPLATGTSFSGASRVPGEPVCPDSRRARRLAGRSGARSGVRLEAGRHGHAGAVPKRSADARNSYRAMAKPPREHRNEYAFPPTLESPFSTSSTAGGSCSTIHPDRYWSRAAPAPGRPSASSYRSSRTWPASVPERGALTGVRALFLYPLNALINSQRDRLRAWCGGFGGDIRFCLYNGETPGDGASPQTGARGCGAGFAKGAPRESRHPCSSPTRRCWSTCSSAPRIGPLLDQSRGKLRWIVLDEAHTYVGSQAAEMALLLRRVLHRFDVDPSNVRFVATSATIGGVDAGNDLQRFLADISGAPPDRVHVVTGERFVPRLPQMDPARTPETLAELQSEALYEALCQHPGARAIRSRVGRETHSARDAIRQ